MTTTDKPNYSQEAYLIVKEAGGQEMTPADVADIFEARGLPMKREVVSAIVAGLPKGSGGRTGVVRVAKGTYAYRPDLAGDTPPSRPSQREKREPVSDQIRAFLKANGPGKVNTRLVADATGLEGRQINQAMANLLRSGEVTRVESGVYQPASSNGAAKPRSGDVFAPLVEALPERLFEEVGMKVVGRTKDGDRLAIDEKGTPWAVTVTVTAKLV